MTVFDEAIVAGPAAAEGICVSCPFREAGPRVLGLEYARERARAEAAEARCEELRRAEVEARSVAGSLKWRLDKCRGELKAVGDEVKSVRRMAKNALALQAEVSRLEKLLSQAGVESGKRSTIMSLREENARLKKDVRAAKDRVGRIKLLERETGDLRFWLRGSHERLERIEARHRDEVDWLNKDIACLRSALGRSADKRNGEMASLRKQFERRHAATVRKVAARDRTIAWLRERNDRLRSAVVRATDLTASLRAKNALLRAEVQASQAGMTALASQAGTLEARLAKLRASRAVLSKTMFGRKSERRKKPRSERKRGRQPGSTGHGRTRRRGLEERTERRDPPKDACVCSYCGKPYAANGERSTTVVEIEVKAYTRKIVRPRRRRSCGCASSPFEVTAPPPARLFDNTPYGISVWVDRADRGDLPAHRADWRLRAQPEVPYEDPRDRGRDAPTVTDDFQNTRLGELERAVHKLAGDISDNKDAFTEILQELRGNGADATPQPPAKPTGHSNGYYGPDHGVSHAAGPGMDDVLDRIYAVQRNVDTKFGELARGWELLGERLVELEEAVEKQPEAKVELDSEFVEAVANQVVASLGDNLSNIVALDGKVDRLEMTLAGLPDRLIAMERRLAQSPTTVDLGPLTRQLTDSSREIRDDLADIEKRVNAVSVSSGGDIEPLLSLMDKVEARVDDTSLLVSGHGERFDDIDKAIANQGVGGDRMKALVDDAMERVSRTFVTQQDAIAGAVANAASTRLGAISTSVQERQSEQNRMLASILEQVTKLETGTGGITDTGPLMTAIDAVARESDATHDALIKLNTNQQTLANAFDQWREESRGELAGLRQHVSGIQVQPGVGGADLNKLQDQIDQLQSSLGERKDFWTRFRIWLYGTNDWYGASWGARNHE